MSITFLHQLDIFCDIKSSAFTQKVPTKKRISSHGSVHNKLKRSQVCPQPISASYAIDKNPTGRYQTISDDIVSTGPYD
jgi:hypothetical protein